MKKLHFILLIVVVAMSCFVVGGKAENYKKITSLNEIEDGAEYVIGSAAADVTDATVIMSSNNTSGYFPVVNMTAANGTITLSDNPSAAIYKWTLKEMGDYYTIQSVATKKYVAFDSGTATVAASSVSDKGKWDVTYVSDRFQFKNYSNGSKGLRYNKTDLYLTTYSLSNESRLDLFLYKKEEEAKYTVTFNDKGDTTSKTESSIGGGVTAPGGTLDNECVLRGWIFVGWSTTQLTKDSMTKPTIVTNANGTYKPKSNITLYAIYALDVLHATSKEHKSDKWTLNVTEMNDNYWVMYKGDYMETPSFASTYIETIVVEMGYIEEKNTLKIENNSTVLATKEATRDNATYTYTITVNKQLSGKLKFSPTTTKSGVGLKIESLTIKMKSSIYSSHPDCDCVPLPTEREVAFVDGTKTTTLAETSSGGGVTSPTATAISSECAEQGWMFAGWSETQLTGETTTPPTIAAKAAEIYYPELDDITLYAVYQQGVSAPTTSYSSKNSDWTVNAGAVSAGGDDYWKIFSGHSITSPSFTDLYVESVTVKMGMYGSVNMANVLQVQNGGVVIATDVANDKVQSTLYTVAINRIISGELVFSSQSTSNNSGLLIQEITLNTAPVYFTPNAPSCDAGSTDVTANADASDYGFRSNLTVKDGATLTCSGRSYFSDVVVEAGGKLVIDDNAKFVAKSLVLHTVKEEKTAEIEYNNIDLVTNITFARELNNDRYYFVSLPCKYKASDITNAAGEKLELYNGSNASTADIEVLFYDGNVRANNPEGINAGTASAWTSINGDDYMEVGVGYNIYVVSPTTIYFPKVSTADINQSTASSVKVFGARRSENEGWNLITHSSLSENVISSGTEYVSCFNGSTYDQKAVADLNLKPFVPFFVQAAEDKDISYGVITTPSSAPALSRDVTTETFKFTIANCNDSEKSDVTTLIINDDYTTDYEIGDDLSKMLSVGTSRPQIYSLYGNIQYAFNAIPKSAITATNLGVYLYEAGDYSISLDIKNGEYETVYLVDNVTNTKHNLINGSYYFTTDGTVYNNSRFSIEMRRVVTGCDDATNDEYMVYTSDGDIYIENLSGEGAVNVYDVAGHLITKQQIVSSDLNITSLPAGVYMVTIEDEESFNSYKVVVR